ncbi:MAG: hypothetical protein P8Z30_00145 [Acidobacteriota bacterium]
MSKTACPTVLLGLMLFLLLPATTPAQTQKTSGPEYSTSQSRKSAEKTPSKLPLRALTLVSTSGAARKAAEEASRKSQTAKGTSRPSSQAGSKEEADRGVMEFHANDSAPLANSATGTFHAKGKEKPALKNIHGSVYGATASGIGKANAVDGAVGADSSNGKINIYVESGHSHAKTPNPH